MKYNSDKYTYYITGTRRGLGHALEKKYGNVNSFECDVFINCKYDMWYQADMLYLAAEAKVTLSLTSWYWRAIRGSASPGFLQNQNWSGT